MDSLERQAGRAFVGRVALKRLQRRWWLAGLALALTLALAPGPAAADQTGLVGQWHLDEDVAGSTPDSSGNGLNGATDAVAVIPGGRFGNAFTFDNGALVRIPDSPLLEPQALTVVAWVNHSGPGPGASRYVLAKGGDAACHNSSYALGTGPAGGLVFLVRDAMSTNGFVSPAVDPLVIWDGQWHAVTGTYDGSRVRLYVDGAEIGSGTPATTAVPYGQQDDSMTIATYPQCPGSGFDYNGYVDEVRVYNRALSPSEIQLLHDPSATSPPVLPPAGGGGGGGGGGGIKLPPTAR